MFDFWLADENVIFAVGGLILAGLAVLQISGITDFAPDLDAESDLGMDGIGDGLLSFLGIGRLPLMIWLALYTMLFTLIGFGGQQFLQSLTGALLPAILAGPAAALAALPLTAILARPLARINGIRLSGSRSVTPTSQSLDMPGDVQRIRAALPIRSDNGCETLKSSRLSNL